MDAETETAESGKELGENENGFDIDSGLFGHEIIILAYLAAPPPPPPSPP